jgi:hypothetical protein
MCNMRMSATSGGQIPLISLKICIQCPVVGATANHMRPSAADWLPFPRSDISRAQGPSASRFGCRTGVLRGATIMAVQAPQHHMCCSAASSPPVGARKSFRAGDLLQALPATPVWGAVLRQVAVGAMDGIEPEALDGEEPSSRSRLSTKRVKISNRAHGKPSGYAPTH